MDSTDTLVKTSYYGDINITDMTTMSYYVIKLLSKAYTLQEDIIYGGQISIDSELVVNAQYMNCMQDNTKWYWKQKNNTLISLFQHAQFYIYVWM